ncbi:MAG: hypothetical protein WCW65_02785, partial [Candidatus Paceibacterota bacterium]
MQNNPKKSKAFIIAFILILLLLIAGYYLFTNRSKIFDAKGDTTLSKVFAPLLGTTKNKDLTVIIDPNAGTDTVKDGTITGIIITDQSGNRIVRAEAGENLKKGDVLYISGFNKNKDPVVMKAIANDKNKSLVFGVAGEDMLKGVMGDVIIEGILTGVSTKKTEITPWAINNILYLSDKVYGAMTKNPPAAPSSIVPVGNVINVDAINGSIRIGNYSNIKNETNRVVRDYFNSIFGNNNENTDDNNNNRGFILNPINFPGSNNISRNFPTVTVVSSPNTPINSGESVTISWISTNTTSCSAGAGRGTGVTGSFNTGPLTKTMYYSVVCTGAGGTGSGNTRVVVKRTNTVTCVSPKILNQVTNTCETPPKTCVAPKVYSFVLRNCTNPPTPE